MSDFLETYLKKLAAVQKKHTKLLAVISILITIVLGIGLKDLSINSDIRSELHTDAPIYTLNDRVSDKFGGADTVVIVVQVDESVDSKSAVRDIRDPRVMQSLLFLDEAIRGEGTVTSVNSLASFFRDKKIVSPEEIARMMRSPQAEAFLSRDHKTTFMVIRADIGSADEKIQSFARFVKQQIDYAPKPTGIKFSITGRPILRMDVFNFLKSDSTFTLFVAAVLILLLLLAMQRSYMQGILIFLPLSLGLTWTMGTLGWLSISLNIATVGLSSMILGLGVEYGVFVLTRYNEERAKRESQLESMKTTVYAIGTAITGSATTTIVGFGVLAFSSTPMIQHLGETLALGIAYCFLAALIANPVIILLAEDYEYWNIKRNLAKLSKKNEELVQRGR